MGLKEDRAPGDGAARMKWSSKGLLAHEPRIVLLTIRMEETLAAIHSTSDRNELLVLFRNLQVYCELAKEIIKE